MQYKFLFEGIMVIVRRTYKKVTFVNSTQKEKHLNEIQR